jgi:glucokinase
VQAVHGRLSHNSDAAAFDLSPQSLDVQHIMRAAQAGQSHCLEAVTGAAEWVGMVIANLINLLNPEVIALGGELFEDNDYFFSLVQDLARQRTLPDYVPGVRLVQSSLRRRAGLQGVAVLALDKLLDPTSA